MEEFYKKNGKQIKTDNYFRNEVVASSKQDLKNIRRGFVIDTTEKDINNADKQEIFKFYETHLEDKPLFIFNRKLATYCIRTVDPEVLTQRYNLSNVGFLISSTSREIDGDYIDKNGEYSIHRFIAKNKDLNILKSQFDRYGTNIDIKKHLQTKNASGQTPLAIALQHDNLDAVTFIINNIIETGEEFWTLKEITSAIAGNDTKSTDLIISYIGTVNEEFKRQIYDYANNSNMSHFVNYLSSLDLDRLATEAILSSCDSISEETRNFIKGFFCCKESRGFTETLALEIISNKDFLESYLDKIESSEETKTRFSQFISKKGALGFFNVLLDNLNEDTIISTNHNNELPAVRLLKLDNEFQDYNNIDLLEVVKGAVEQKTIFSSTMPQKRKAGSDKMAELFNLAKCRIFSESVDKDCAKNDNDFEGLDFQPSGSFSAQFSRSLASNDLSIENGW